MSPFRQLLSQPSLVRKRSRSVALSLCNSYDYRAQLLETTSAHPLFVAMRRVPSQLATRVMLGHRINGSLVNAMALNFALF